MTRLYIAANGMPDYTARLVRQLISDYNGQVEVIATRPTIPIRGMETSLGKKVYWIDPDDRDLRFGTLNLPIPDFLLLGGYFQPAFRKLAKEVRKTGGAVILASDNNWNGTLWQRFIESAYHRQVLRKKFDGVMTAGASGIRYSTAMGYPREFIVPGIYGADPSLFYEGELLEERSRQFLFVGQFIARKNVRRLCDAFIRFHATHEEWQLVMCGSGRERANIPNHPSIEVRDFVQPPELGKLLRESRCLILPSIEEHWGVVVHEAALSGCVLALSHVVGAADDLAGEHNSILFDPLKVDAIYEALVDIAKFDSARWAAAQEQSRELGTLFGPQRFSSELRGLVAKITRHRVWG